MKMPSTRSLPSALTHRAATTELSMPPERPTTAPRRRSVPMTCCRMDSATDAATAGASIARISFVNIAGGC